MSTSMPNIKLPVPARWTSRLAGLIIIADPTAVRTALEQASHDVCDRINQRNAMMRANLRSQRQPRTREEAR